MKRTVSLILLAAMLLSVLISCGDSAPAADDTSAADTTAAPAESTTETAVPETTNNALDSLPEKMDFQGAAVSIISSTKPNCYGPMDVAEVDKNSTILEQSIYDRNRSVEERLKIKITETTGTEATLQKTFTTSAAAGDDAFQISQFADRINFAISLEGYHLDLAKDVPHVDLSKDYWFAKGNEVMSLGGKQYSAFGDMSLGTYDYTYLLGFNQKMLEENKLKSPYDYFKEDQWTFDNFAALAAAVKKDLNGDGVMDDNDRYGYQARDGAMYVLMYNAAGLKTVLQDKDGTPYFNVPNTQAFYDVYDWCRTNFIESGSTYLKSTAVNFIPEQPLFVEDKVLFVSLTFYYVGAIREMVSDFGIVVYPKYTADQKEYYSYCSGGSRTVAVSKVTKNPESVGAMLEAMGSKSMETVIPTYYEINLKTKYARDEIASQMFDLIRDTRAFDLGDQLWYKQVRSILGNAFRDQKPLASTVASIETAVNKEITSAMEKLK